MNWYEKYKDNVGSVGYVLYYLNEIRPSWIVESTVFDEIHNKGGSLEYYGKLYATYEYDENNVPVFTLVKE